VEREELPGTVQKQNRGNLADQQVSAKIFKIIQILAEKSSTFGKPSAALCIGQLTDKLGDMKLKAPSGDTLTTIAEKTSLAFVLTQGMLPISMRR
jgi:cytoskeleton-associated protein 5